MTPDVLASRYASQAMCQIWSAEERFRLERRFWIAVMKAQQTLGADIPDHAIVAYEQQVDAIDLESIDARERVLRHDVKARIEEFCHLAGHEYVHRGMTSRDLTDNVEQLQLVQSLQLVQKKTLSLLHHLAEQSKAHRSTLLVGRTHNVPAQPTTLGKRFAMFGDEILMALSQLESFLGKYPLRGLQGAVGTQLDQWTLLGKDTQALEKLNTAVREHLGMSQQWNAVGQVYPRSLDTQAISHLYAISSGISSLAKTLRLMAGQQLLTEGFQKGQVGSSAMPHKMNTRNSERINGFHTILNGYLNMVMGLSGDQWNEGDVSCSVVRRVALPGAFYAIDGMLETALTVLKEMGAYDAVIAKECEQQLPFLATTSIMMACVQKGTGRETAHECIKQHAVAVAEQMRFEGKGNDLLERLAQDPQIPLTLDELQQLLSDPQQFTACAESQVDTFVEQVQQQLTAFPDAKSYQPETLI